MASSTAAPAQLECCDLVDPAVILGHHDVVPAVQMGGRHCPEQGPHRWPCVGLIVLPSADQAVRGNSDT